MRFCSKYNITWALHRLADNPYFNIDEDAQAFRGQGSFLVTKYLLLRKDDELHEVRQHCRFVLSAVKQDGSSQIESLAMIMNGSADGNIRPTTFFTNSNLIDFVGVLKAESYNSIQYVDNQPIASSKQAIEVFLSMKSFFKYILVCYVLTFLIGSAICLLTYRKRSSNKMKLILQSMEAFFGFKISFFKKPNALGLFLILFVLFRFLVQNIILNNIGSSSVIVDTSFLITSIDKILTTNRKLCFNEPGPESDFFEFAPKGSIPYRIFYDLKFPEYRCYAYSKGKLDFTPYHPLDSFFIIAFIDSLKVALGYVQASALRNVFLFNKPYFEILKTLLIRRNLDAHLKKNIADSVYFLSEHGLFAELYKQIAVFFNSKFRHGYRTFYTVKEYLNEYVLITRLELGNFKLLFFIFFSIQSSLVVLFIMSILFDFIRLQY